jgi:hypothetical protein
MADLANEIMSGLPTQVELEGAYQKPEQLTESILETPDEVSVWFSFSEKGFGFGEFCIKRTRDGVFVDIEAMGIEKIKQYLGLLLDSAITDVDDDADKHERYCCAMNRSCGPACRQCGGVAQLERIEAKLAERLGLTGDVRAQLIQLAKDGQLTEDELVSDWHEGYAWYLSWRAESTDHDQHETSPEE